MTTNTREQLHERARRKVKELEFAITQSAFTSIRDGLNEELDLARIALASLDAEPVGYFYADKPGDWYQISDGDRVPSHRRIPLYAVPPVQETGVYKDMLNIIGLLENNEWAEHCTSTVLGSLLESEITRLIGKEQLAPVVPEKMPKGLAGQIVSLLAHNIGDKLLAQKIWNTCRAAMLNGGKS